MQAADCNYASLQSFEVPSLLQCQLTRADCRQNRTARRPVRVRKRLLLLHSTAGSRVVRVPHQSRLLQDIYTATHTANRAVLHAEVKAICNKRAEMLHGLAFSSVVSLDSRIQLQPQPFRALPGLRRLASPISFATIRQKQNHIVSRMHVQQD